MEKGAGGGKALGDGRPARRARFCAPVDVALDGKGNLYVADYAAVRKIDPRGTITTIAGTGGSRVPFDPQHVNSAPRERFTGEGGRATDAMLHADDVSVDADGGVLVADDAGDRVYRIDRRGIIRTVAGTVSGKGRRLGDGGPATSAFIDGTAAVGSDRMGNLVVAVHHGERIPTSSTPASARSATAADLCRRADGRSEECGDHRVGDEAAVAGGCPLATQDEELVELGRAVGPHDVGGRGERDVVT